MTVACDVPRSFPVPLVHTGDAIGTAPAQPLMITCVGEVEYTEDDPALGTWWQQQTLTVGRCASVTEAITFASIAVEREEFPFDDYEAFGFSPRLFVILDSDKRLVLAGEIWGTDIRWCAPVSADAEARCAFRVDPVGDSDLIRSPIPI
ncbi:hypothetical protein D2T29_16320 [Sinirhodobacter populi]|uniref:Uncharacterized protein n=1 Tax=Paenirhodobacter populi TaxID=2306993 RepID=A0A443K7L0_9RHOB|nr:hypothetical protein [Sinirhodobacter populi]RWR28777.1 hypothetical protein D2T29_16320 [Sinirhodobacter populi]